MRFHSVGFIFSFVSLVLSSMAFDATVYGLRQIHESVGPHCMVRKGRSQSELTCFLDTVSQLHEACQRAHSRAVGLALQRWRSSER